MQVLPTPDGGTTRLKMLQKSLGVMRGKEVGPNAEFGRLRGCEYS